MPPYGFIIQRELYLQMVPPLPSQFLRISSFSFNPYPTILEVSLPPVMRSSCESTVCALAEVDQMSATLLE